MARTGMSSKRRGATVTIWAEVHQMLVMNRAELHDRKGPQEGFIWYTADPPTF